MKKWEYCVFYGVNFTGRPIAVNSPVQVSIKPTGIESERIKGGGSRERAHLEKKNYANVARRLGDYGSR